MVVLSKPQHMRRIRNARVNCLRCVSALLSCGRCCVIIKYAKSRTQLIFKGLRNCARCVIKIIIECAQLASFTRCSLLVRHCQRHLFKLFPAYCHITHASGHMCLCVCVSLSRSLCGLKLKPLRKMNIKFDFAIDKFWGSTWRTSGSTWVADKQTSLSCLQAGKRKVKRGRLVCVGAWRRGGMALAGQASPAGVLIVAIARMSREAT